MPDALPPFLAFATDDASLATLKEFAAAQGWPENCVQKGDITTATIALKTAVAPLLLLIDLPTAKDAPAQLDALADVCDPQTKVITVGAINEYSFYCWLMDIGIFSYLLKPLTVAMLEAAHKKAVTPVAATISLSKEKTPGKLIAVIGARGGVGATTLALNLAGILSARATHTVALIDIDAQEGGISLLLDIEPSRGIRDALEKPDRIDTLFIERVIAKPSKYLSVLSAEESLQDKIVIHDQAATALLKELRSAFDVSILDVPRHMNHFARECLRQADQVVLVTELTLLSLRDTLRLGDLLRETLKAKPPLIVANRVGLSAKNEVQPGNFEQGISGKLVQRIAFAPDVYMQIGTDIPAVKMKNHASVKPLYALAEQLVPAANAAAQVAKGGLFRKKKG